MYLVLIEEIGGREVIVDIRGGSLIRIFLGGLYQAEMYKKSLSVF